MRKDTRFKITLGVFTLALATLLAAQPPTWWSSASNPVVDPNATPASVDQNYAPANLGQLKFIAKQAKLHLDANLSGGSGLAITSLVSGFTPQQGVSYTQAELDALREANYAPINLGQLKAVAKPFYDRLDSAGYDTKANLIARGFPDKWSGTDAWTGYYPWNPATPVAENYAPANLGQLKMVFSFDLSGFDSDGDGMPDTWEIAHGFNPEDNSDASPTADADGDGLSNLAEFQQNSDPNNYYSQGSQTITPVVSISDGNTQSGSPDGFLPEPIKVSVTNADGGAPLIGAPVSFVVATGAGGLASEASSYSTVTPITISTDSAGIATAYWKLGANPGFQQVSAQSGSAPAVTFSATSLPADGLWGHWRFFEGAGTIAADTSGFGHPGTLTNSPIWVAGQNADGALSFSGAATEGGTKDYVTMGNPTDRSLDFGQDSFTMAVWVKFTAAAIAPGQYGRRIVSKGHHGWNAGYCLGINPNGSFFAGVGTTLSGQGTQCVFVWTQSAFNDGQWHHLAAVFDRSTSTARILVDGVRQNLVNDALAGGTVVNSKLLDFSALQNLSATRADMPLTIGSHMGQYDFYKGELDDVRLYRRALSDDEIAGICGQTGLLKALAQTVTLAEDTLGTISLKSTGGADTVTTTYEIVTPPANGEAVLDGATISYYPKAHFNGTDNLTFRATNGSQTSEAIVAITVTPVDDPPLVSVGGGRTVTLPEPLSLAASVTDVDTPPEEISPKWMKVSGPGDVTFSSDSVLNPTVTFSAPGEYVLRLTATDGSSMRSDSLQVVVNPSTATGLPVVTLSSPADNQAFSLNQAIPLAASVSAPAGTAIEKVEFFEGSRKIGESLAAGSGGNYGISWTPPRLGAYLVSAKATLVGGAAAFTSGGVQVRVTQGGWFNDSSIIAGNEGYTGSGGSGGIIIGANSGPSGNYANNGSAGPGPSAGNPVGQGGSDVDSDGDGLSDEEEALRGTIANGEAGYDTDGDGLSDSQDAVPTNAIMKVKAAPEVSYAIVDLGASSDVGSVLGINDRGEVLFSKYVNNPSPGKVVAKLWSSGNFYELPEESNRVVALLQDGSVYFVTKSVTESTIAGGSTSERRRKIWKRGSPVSDGGPGYFYISKFENDSENRVMPPSSLPGIPEVLQSKVVEAFAEAREALSDGGWTLGPVGDGNLDLWYDTQWVNDAHRVGMSALLVCMERGQGYSPGRESTISAQVYGDDAHAFSGGVTWQGDYYETLTFSTTLYVAGASANRVNNFRRYSDGSYTYTLQTDSSKQTFINGAEASGCSTLVDAAVTASAEGPYYIGDDGKGEAGLWCDNGGNPAHIKLKGMPAFVGSHGAIERRITRNLVTLGGSMIWRNGRTRSLADLTGMTGENPVWTNLSASLISPENNLIAGTASREGASHSVLLVPIEITFEPVGDNDNISDNKNPQTGKWMDGKGKRIFPDAKTPNDSTARNKVYVKVKAGIPNIKVHLKAFDVDDPSSDTTIDPSDAENGGHDGGNDNLEFDNLGFRKPPLFSNGQQTIECTTDSEGIAKVGGQLPELEVTMHAGDNFRVAVALMDEGSTELTKAQVMDKGASGYIAGNSDQHPTGFNGVVSPMLTVWRKLNMEVDSMLKWSGTKPDPDHVTVTASGTWQVNSPGLGQATLPISSLSGPADAYAGGYIQKGSLKFDIVTNTSSSITVNPHTPSSQMPVSDLSQFESGSFDVYDDDDIGLTGDPLPRSNLINDEVKKIFTPAYIEIREVGSDLNPHSTIPYESSNNVANPWTALDNAQDMKGTDRAAYWNHLLVVAYQPEPSVDSDPNGESKKLGVTVEPGVLPLYNSFSVVYVESIRDFYDGLRTTPAQMEAAIQGKIEEVTGHEIGHAPGGQGEAHDHSEGGLMTTGTETGEKEFTPATIKRLREAKKWH